MSAAPSHLQISDRRDGGRYLRVSWHHSRRVVVFSHWRDGVCVASTPVELAELPSIVGVLVQALADAMTLPTKDPPAPSARSVRRDVGERLRAWVRPRLAPIIELRPERGSKQSCN
ncbi:MAG TPA: hypothetical protein VIX85_09700 [Acidimicrobiales bacterium]